MLFIFQDYRCLILNDSAWQLYNQVNVNENRYYKIGRVVTYIGPFTIWTQNKFGFLNVSSIWVRTLLQMAYM